MMAETEKKQTEKKQVNKYNYYEISGDTVTRKKKSCPRCGQGVFLAEHKDRLACGKCGYTEFSGKRDFREKPKTEADEGAAQVRGDVDAKKEEKPAEEKKEEPKEGAPEEEVKKTQ